MTDPDVLKAVEAAIRRSTSVKKMKIEGSDLRWSNVPLPSSKEQHKANH